MDSHVPSVNAAATSSFETSSDTARFEARVKAAKKAVVSSGMRIGRLGMMLSTAGLALAIAAWKLDSSLSKLGMVIGLAGVLFGLLPFGIGWGLSKSGSPFLRALSEPGVVQALLVEPKPMAGGRRSLALLLTDGTRQTAALPDADARSIVELVGVLSPASERGEREGAQRAVAQLSAA